MSTAQTKVSFCQVPASLQRSRTVSQRTSPGVQLVARAALPASPACDAPPVVAPACGVPPVAAPTFGAPAFEAPPLVAPARAVAPAVASLCPAPPAPGASARPVPAAPLGGSPFATDCELLPPHATRHKTPAPNHLRSMPECSLDRARARHEFRGAGPNARRTQPRSQI